MARLPDRFDLWVRKAREYNDPARQLDYVLGAMSALPDWYFINIGSNENPRPAVTEIENERQLVVFSDAERIREIVGDKVPASYPLPLITIPSAKAMAWCLEQNCTELLVNPGDEAVVVPLTELKKFLEEWTQRGGREASGYWIPNLTSEEEDFWQKHGL
jgi:hypothetical protein